jgi:hypothetical protein
MVYESLRDVQNSLVNEYLRKRNRQRIIEERDPLGLAMNGILDGVLISLGREAVRDAIKVLAYQSLIETQFLKLFNT